MKLLMKRMSVLIMAFLVISAMSLPAFADDGDGEGDAVYQDGFYTTTVNTDKESYGYQTDADGNITSRGMSNPKQNYDFPVTVQIQDGKIVDVAYTIRPIDIYAYSSSDANYLMWAMDGHNVTDYSYNYLAAEGKNYDKYHIDPKPPKNGVGMRDQIIAANGTDGVDTVTAATITSLAIKRAVDANLEKAKAGEKDDPAPELPQPDTSKAVIPKDGIYMAKDVACIGATVENDVAPTFLYVKDGTISAEMAVTQQPSSYPYIYAGTEAEALAAGESGWLESVAYDYGYKNPGSIYHNVPIASLDKPLNFVMHAKSSGNWFNRLITISSDKLVKIPYGDYQANDFSFEGGTGRVTLTCEKVHVTRDGITFDIAFSSSKYTTAEVNGVEYTPVVKDGKSVFTIPMNINGQTVVSGTTTAMSSPQTIDYTCTVKFNADELNPIEKVYQDGFYTTTVNSDKESYGYQMDASGNITSRGMSNPKQNYDFPVTIQIKGGKIVDVAYTIKPIDIYAYSSSDINYLMWAMDGHNVTDASYNYLAADGKNYDKYNINPKPAKNGVGMKEQIIAANGTNDVDTVTAATITSRAIIKSVDASLEKAERGEKDNPAPTIPGPDTSSDIIPAEGTYIVDAEKIDCMGATIDSDVASMVLYVDGGKIIADMGVQQRQSSYPYIYAGTEEEALAAGESGWLYPADYDYGYTSAGSMYKNVPIRSLDKPLNFVMYAKGSGNWFNRFITVKSSTLLKIPQEADKAKYSEETYAAVQTAFQNFITVRDTAGSEDTDIQAAKDTLIAAAKAAKAERDAAEKAEATESAKASVEKAGKVDKNKYTAKSYAAVQKALADLKAVLAKEDATKEEIAAAQAALDKAMAGLTGIKNNPMQVKGTNKTIKKKAVKKKAQTFKAVTVTKAQGKVTYTTKPANKKAKKALKFNSKTGKITVKKGTKKGKYVMTITVKATGNDAYKAATKTVKITVKVK